MSLTEQQKLFANEYLIDLNATAAYGRAGYKATGNSAEVNANRLLRNAKVQEYIQKRMKDREKRTEITQDMVLREYAKIGFSNIADYLKVDEREYETEDGIKTYKVVDIFATDTIERSKLDAVAEIKQTKDGIALKLHDKKGALDSIARHLGMFTDKIEHSGDIKLVVKRKKVQNADDND